MLPKIRQLCIHRAVVYGLRIINTVGYKESFWLTRLKTVFWKLHWLRNCIGWAPVSTTILRRRLKWFGLWT